MKHFLFLALFLSVPGLAEAGPEACQSQRKVKATVTIHRMHWAQERGNYQLKSEQVCKVETWAPVFQGPLKEACTYRNLATCPILLDGRMHRINATGNLHFNDDPQPHSKHFTAWYHLDRNSGSVQTGEASSADVTVPDDSVKKLTVSLQSKLDGPAPGQKVRDGVRVTIDYEETDAP